MKRNIASYLVISALLAAIFLAPVVVADPYGVNEANAGTSERYDTSGISAKQVNAQAGNVTELTLNATAITNGWQGFYGNITGKIILADASGNNFYDWDLAMPSGEVYAARTDSITWSGVNCSNATEVGSENDFLNKSASDPDSVTNTFNVTSHPWFLIGSNNITGCYSTKAYDSSGGQGSGFWQVLLSDGSSNTIYSTIIESSGLTGFNNQNWQFELLVAENGKPGYESTTPYYFFVELE